MCSDRDDAVAREQQAQLDDGFTADGAMNMVRRRTASPEKKRAMAGAYAGFSDEAKDQIRERNAGSRLSGEELTSSAVALEPPPGGDLPDPRTFWLGE